MTRVTIIRRCPPSQRCAACKTYISMAKGKRPAIVANIRDPASRWTHDELFHPACYDNRHGEPQRRSA